MQSFIPESSVQIFSYLVNFFFSIQTYYSSHISVVLENWLSEIMVLFQSILQHSFIVILSLDQTFTSDIIFSLNFRRIELNMIASSALRMDSSSSNSFNQSLIIYLELNNLVQLFIPFLKDIVQSLSLSEVSGVSIKNITISAFWRLKLTFNKTQN